MTTAFEHLQAVQADLKALVRELNADGLPKAALGIQRAVVAIDETDLETFSEMDWPPEAPT